MLSILVVAGVIPLIHHSIALTTNFNVISKQMGNLKFASGLAALEIALIFISTYFSKDLIQSHFRKKGKVRRFVSLIPSVFFISGILLIQLWLFHNISGFDYIWISVLFSISIFILLFTLVLFMRLSLKDWTLRLEIRTMFSLLLMMGAMVLPVFFQNISIIEVNNTAYDLSSTWFVVLLVLLGCCLGYVNYKYQITEYIWNRFIKS